MPALRTAYLVLAGLTLLFVTVQFVIAGLLIFEDRDFVDAHGALAGVLHLFPLLMVVAAAVARMGREAVLFALALLVLVTVQSGLPNGSGVVASLHPLGALLIFVLAHVTLQRARGWRAAAPAQGRTGAGTG